jgi:hypothetical protein
MRDLFLPIYAAIQSTLCVFLIVKGMLSGPTIMWTVGLAYLTFWCVFATIEFRTVRCVKCALTLRHHAARRHAWTGISTSRWLRYNALKIVGVEDPFVSAVTRLEEPRCLPCRGSIVDEDPFPLSFTFTFVTLP